MIHPLNEELINGFLNNEKFLMITLNNLNNINLNQIHQKSKLELLISNSCHNCSNNIYYQCLSQEQNNQINFSSKSIFQNCPYKENFYNTKLLINEINEYRLLGINHFKIATPDIKDIN